MTVRTRFAPSPTCKYPHLARLHRPTPTRSPRRTGQSSSCASRTPIRTRGARRGGADLQEPCGRLAWNMTRQELGDSGNAPARPHFAECVQVLFGIVLKRFAGWARASSVTSSSTCQPGAGGGYVALRAGAWVSLAHPCSTTSPAASVGARSRNSRARPAVSLEVVNDAAC